MTTPQLKLIHVLTRGPNLPKSSDTFNGIEYRREPAGSSAVYLTVELPRRRDSVKAPVRDDEGLKITVLKFPFAKSAGVEFCGTEVDAIVAAAGQAQSGAAAVGVLAPLLRAFEENFGVA